MKRIGSKLRRWPDSLKLLLFGCLREERSHPVMVATSKVVEPSPEELEADIPEIRSYEEMDAILKKWAMEPENCRKDYDLETLSISTGLKYEQVKDYLDNYLKKCFRSWKLYMKLECAKKMLLEEEGLRVSEVALRTGFSNRSNFYRQFKKNVGCTPYQWRSCRGNQKLL